MNIAINEDKITISGTQLKVVHFTSGAKQPWVLQSPDGKLHRYNRDGTFVGKSFPHDNDLIGSRDA
jgi:hypothetical protein